MPLSNFGTEGYYLEIANIFERAIRLIWTGPDADRGECCDVIVHTSDFKNGPYVSLRLQKQELALAQDREMVNEVLAGPPEEYEGRIRNFSPETRASTLYPSVIYIFLRDGFTLLAGEYQSLDRWHVSRA
jgi:hypothetical protein